MSDAAPAHRLLRRREGAMGVGGVFAAAVMVLALTAGPATADPPAPNTPVPNVVVPDPAVVTVPTTGVPTPVTDHCPHRVTTPPAVDASEAVPPGSPTPTPLPVSDPPVGGDRLGECGLVADPAAGTVPDRISSAGWLVADLDTGAVVAAKDPHGRYRPASTIKVLLAQVVLDELDLDETVEATDADWMTEGDSCGMGPRGRYTNRDLLTGLLMVSGNDCANAFATQLGGVEETLAKMNAKARALGARDTRAASPSGLDAAGMSSSPYDLALIFRAAMAYPTFAELIALTEFRFPGYPRRVDVPDDTDHPAWMMATSNHLLLEGYPGTLGGKTGFTDDARKTFVGAVERDGRRLIVVQMFGFNEPENSYWDQAKALLDYGFSTPRATSVGALTEASGRAPGESSADPTATGTAHRSESATFASDSPTRSSLRIVIGLVAAIAALICLAIGIRLFSRR